MQCFDMYNIAKDMSVACSNFYTIAYAPCCYCPINSAHCFPLNLKSVMNHFNDLFKLRWQPNQQVYFSKLFGLLCSVIFQTNPVE